MKDSQYVCHFGKSVDFCSKAEGVIDSYGRLNQRLVFITDGASWIRNWIEDSYPDACAILDYYHACEHLHQFADRCSWPNLEDKHAWCCRQKELLLDSQTHAVIENIGKAAAKEKDKQQLRNYYTCNLRRMDYKRYRSMGCGIIGSGAIESAHRTVVQKRMKLSGQRWSRKGAQNMLRLRVLSMNKQWHKVAELLKTPAAKAA